MSWLRVCWRWLATLLARLFRRTTEPFEEPPGTDGPFELDYLMAGYTGLVWPEKSGPVDSPFSRDEFFAVGSQQAKPRLDQRHREALEQQLDLRASRHQEWRQSPVGHVVRTPGGREALVLKEPVRRPSAESSLRMLIDRQGAVRDQLGDAGARVDLLWPREIMVGFDGGIGGYFTDSLDRSFVTEVRHSGPTIRTLPFAHVLGGRRNEGISAEERLDLVRLVAQWVGAMHAAAVIHGSVTPTSIAFSLAPIRMAPLNYATARVEGSGPWLNQAAVANSATMLPAETQPDDDRRGFAQIAFSLLVPEAGGDLSRFMSDRAAVPGLDRPTTNRLRWLWARASGAPGTMPTVDEWLRVLGVDLQPVQQGRRHSVERNRLNMVADQPED